MATTKPKTTQEKTDRPQTSQSRQEKPDARSGNPYERNPDMDEQNPGPSGDRMHDVDQKDPNGRSEKKGSATRDEQRLPAASDKPAKEEREATDQERLDEASEESFPASDPPGWRK